AAGHIALADWAEVAVLAPATADAIGRLAHGLADDVVTATLIAIEPRRWLLAPAMNEKMWASPAGADNVELLRQRGARIVWAAVGAQVIGVRVVVMTTGVGDQERRAKALQKVEGRVGEETLA